MRANITLQKSELFALEVIKLYKYLTEEQHDFILSKQILRSGTSVGANISESECAASKKDFLNKLTIALKECNETLYWLRLLFKSEYINKEYFDSIYLKCYELKKILTSSTLTIKEKIGDVND